MAQITTLHLNAVSGKTYSFSAKSPETVEGGIVVVLRDRTIERQISGEIRTIERQVTHTREL